ncbi:hypothetical protein GEMRC1_007583 [Eukaryota sp. GEM-RC1]
MHILFLLSLFAVLSLANYRCLGIDAENTFFANSTISRTSDWSYSVSRSVWNAPALIALDHLYFLTNQGLVKLDLASGKVLTSNTDLTGRSVPMVSSPPGHPLRFVILSQQPNPAQLSIADENLNLLHSFNYASVSSMAVKGDSFSFVYHRIIWQYSFNGILRFRRSISSNGDLYPSSLGFYLQFSHSVLLLHDDFSTIWEHRIPYIRAISFDNKLSRFFVGHYHHTLPDIHMLSIYSAVGPRLIQTYNVSSNQWPETVRFTAVLKDGSMLFGLSAGKRDSDYPLRIGVVPSVASGYGEVRFIYSVVNAIYQGHTVLDHDVIAVSYFLVDTSETVIVVISVSTEVAYEVSRHSGSGDWIIGFGDHCLAYSILPTVPNTVYVKCF